jgi:hypothetical protein
MATNMKSPFISYEQKLWTHSSIVYILRQLVADVNSCRIIWLCQLMYNCYFIQTTLNNLVAVEADPSEMPVSCTERHKQFLRTGL